VTTLTTTGRPKHSDTAIGGKLEGRRAPPSGVCGRLKAATQRWRSGGRLELDHAGGIALAWIGHGRHWVVLGCCLAAFREGAFLMDVVELAGGGFDGAACLIEHVWMGERSRMGGGTLSLCL
jgi:hypothetical protein